MPTVVKAWLYDGTEYRRGYASRGLDNLVVTAHVTGTSSSLSDARTFIENAVAYCGTAAGSVGDSTLLLYDAKVTRITDNKAWVTLHYGRSQATPPTITANQATVETVDYEWDPYAIEIASEPYNPFGGGTATASFVNYRKGSSAVRRLAMPTVLSTRPGAGLDAITNKINADTVTVGERTWAPKTLRFDGAQIQPIETGPVTGTASVVKYRVTYHFTGKSTPWTYQPRFFLVSFGGTIGTVPHVDRFGTAVFTGAFTVHA